MDSLKVISVKLDTIQEDVKEIKITLRQDYVTREEFDPIKKGFYGLVSAVLLAFVGAVVALVIRT